LRQVVEFLSFKEGFAMFGDQDDYGYDVPEDEYRQAMDEERDEMTEFLNADKVEEEAEVDDFDDADDFDADYYNNLYDSNVPF